MPEDLNLSEDERKFEHMLCGIHPMTTAINRDRLMFAAGKASVVLPVVWPWRIACGIAIFSFTALLISRSTAPAITERGTPAATHANSTPPPSQQANEDLLAYVRIRRDVVARGIDALPEPGAANDPANDSDFNDELPLWRRTKLLTGGPS